MEEDKLNLLNLLIIKPEIVNDIDFDDNIILYYSK